MVPSCVVMNRLSTTVYPVSWSSVTGCSVGLCKVTTNGGLFLTLIDGVEGILRSVYCPLKDDPTDLPGWVPLLIPLG